MIDYEDLLRRYRLNDESLPVHAKVGDEIWYCGDIIENPHKVIVSKEYIHEKHIFGKKYVEYAYANAFWNKLYFADLDHAERRNREAHSDYGAYQAMAAGSIR